MSAFLRQFLVLTAAMLIYAAASVGDSFRVDFSDQQLAALQERFGEPARMRVSIWAALIRSGSRKADDVKLLAVNNFFNRLKFVPDQVHWSKSDYWATPLELLTSGSGDCEDYAIGKYFTLLAMGVPSDKLKITYVKANGFGLQNESHMVLAYYAEAGAVPLILDNLDGDIKAADRRRDLVPVYSFNGDGLWLAKERGAGNSIEGGNTLSMWRDMMSRMENEL